MSLRRLSCLLPALLIPLLLSCQNQDQVQTQSLHLALSEDPPSFDPRTLHMSKDIALVKQIYEGLTRIDAAGVPIPALAESWEVSEDGLHYLFHLRPSKWSNGESLTAYDFERSWREVLNPDFSTPYAFILYPLKNGALLYQKKCTPEELGVKALDESTLSVELEHPTPYFLELTAFMTYLPTAPQSSFKDNTISNGPFVLKTYLPQREILLEKNPLYWEASKVFLQQIVYSIIPDQIAEHHLFEKGKIDWLGPPISSNIPTEFLSHYKEKELLHSCPVAGTFWIVFNNGSSPFNSLKMRQAFAQAISRKEIIEHILQGKQKVATSLLPPSLALQKTPFFEDGNTQSAVALFEEALSEMKIDRSQLPSIVFKYINRPAPTKIAQLIQRQLEIAFKIPIQLQGMELQVYRSQLQKGDFHLGMGEWLADFHDPISFLELFVDTPYNTSQWSNKTFDALIAQAKQSPAGAKRTELLTASERLFMEEMPITPLYHYAFDYLKNEYFRDITFSPFGIVDFKSAYFIEEGAPL